MGRRSIRAATASVPALVVGVLFAQGHATTRQDAPRWEFSEVHMGVPVRLVFHAGDARTARAAASAAFARVAALDRALSDYRPDSELNRLSTTAKQWVAVSADLFAVLDKARDMARATDGAFDPTMGPFVRLWREARQSGRLPASDAMADARARVGWQLVELDPRRRAVRLAATGMRLDLGGVAKGFVLDEALAALRAHGVTQALLEAGGDILAGAAPPGRPGWRVDVPGATGPFAARAAALVEAALATSGRAAQFVDIDGVRYSHVVDPASGIGLTHDVTVHVLAATAATADALATAVGVAGGPACAGAMLATFPGAMVAASGTDPDPARACRTAAPAPQSSGLRTPGVAVSAALAIVNGRIVDGTGGPVVDRGVVVVAGNRIAAVGRVGEVEIPRGALRLDAAGGTIMPGVIDSHVHLFPTLTQRFARGQDIVTPWIQAGVTTMVDTGSVRYMTRAARALASTVPHPPRLFMAGPMLTVPGGYPGTRREADAGLITWEVRGADDAYATVVRLIENEGVDLVKVAIETGFQTDYRDTGWPTLSPDELAAIVRAAHERGVRVRAHVSNPGELEAALVAGIDVLAHTPIHPVPDDLIQRAVDAGMIFTSTANIWGAARGRVVAGTLRRVHERGGVVAIGTDHPYQRGSEMPVNEMRVLLDAGFTPAELLVCATRNGARALGLEADLGTLEPGKLADIIVVAGRPDEDLEALHDVRLVVRDGEVVKRVTAAPQHPRRDLRAAEALVHVETSLGEIDVAVNLERAPLTSTNFLRYVEAGLYTNGRFHRATRSDNYTPSLPNRPMMELIQGGIDPARRAESWPPIMIERTRDTGLRHVAGTVSMARGAPDSATSDFFILLDDQPSLDFEGLRFDDGQGAAAFGRVVHGLEVVRAIQQQPVQEQRLTPPIAILRAERVR
ncbi:MAG TPA: FAD:protein FMN transferase [Vicinamibacterales bacterium]|nr:FAD:protein FMN transferase [Vicinamibacterales bacterium]